MSFNKKIYIDKPYLTELDSEVTQCIAKENGTFEIRLKETIFYPHMVGGQLRDFGEIDGIEVINTKEDEKTEEVIHITKKPLSGKVHLNIDKERRFDLTQQHTGQHILSAAFWSLYKGKTIGFHMSDLYTTIDIALEDINEEMLKNVESLANKSIYANIPVQCNVYTRDEAIATGLRKPPVDCNTIRTVKIADIDNIACCGTHLNTTGETGIIKIVKCEHYKGGLRVEFLCGKRALKYFQYLNSTINTLSVDFSCKNDEILHNIDKLKTSNEQLSKKITRLNKELSVYKIETLKKEAKNLDGVMIKIFEDEDSKQLRNIITELITENSLAAIFINKTSKGLNILYAKSENIELDLKKSFSDLMKIIDGKGGGNSTICQGSCKNSEKITDIINFIN